jgi:hypothetical protein
MKHIKYNFLLVVLFLISQIATAQSFNNEWIDFSKTYYKFKLATNGLYRINKTDLPTAMQNSPSEHFQLWRNGKQISIYTSVQNGTLPANGYIEFWGVMNDGEPDKVLYREQSFQLSDKISLQTDTAAYFLTINPNSSQNNRYLNATNNVAGNVLPPEPFFKYSLQFNFKERIHRGHGENAGERVTSSSYDIGEGWGTREITTSNPYNFSSSNLYPYSSGASGNIKLAVNGVSYLSRNVTLKLNNTAYVNNQLLVNQQSAILTSAVPMSAISNGNNDFSIQISPVNISDNVNRIYTAYVNLTYSRLFNFGNSTNFEFSLEPSLNAGGTYIEISNFNSTATPVLYDFTNNLKYTAVVDNGLLKFALPFSSSVRNFVLVSQDISAIHFINQFQSKTFINFNTNSNQANYLIISNKIAGINVGEAVDLYRQYRASSAGGSFNAKNLRY